MHPTAGLATPIAAWPVKRPSWTPRHSKALLKSPSIRTPLTNGQVSALHEAQLAHHAHARESLERTRCASRAERKQDVAATTDCSREQCVYPGAALPARPRDRSVPSNDGPERPRATLSLSLITPATSIRRATGVDRRPDPKTVEAHDGGLVFNCNLHVKAPNTVKVVRRADHAQGALPPRLHLPAMCLKTICAGSSLLPALITDATVARHVARRDRNVVDRYRSRILATLRHNWL